MGKIIFNDEPYGSSFNNARNIFYDNTDSKLSATTVQDSIDELSSNILEKVYPGDLFGGTWESFGEGTNSSTGSGTAHNNLQPYITCYMWKRTA